MDLVEKHFKALESTEWSGMVKEFRMTYHTGKVVQSPNFKDTSHMKEFNPTVAYRPEKKKWK